MSDFDWDRKGPPRPGSGSVDHPRGLERPYVHVTEQQKADKAKERQRILRKRKENGLAILLAEIRANIAEMRARSKGKAPEKPE